MHRVLVVGVGSIGERHLRCFAATGRARLSLCEVDPDLRRTVAGRYAVTDAFADLDAALSSSPEVVVVCTPAHLHVSMARAAVRAGAHVLIEKPLSTAFDGVSELLEEVERRRIVAAVAYVYRAHSALAALREAIRAGRFGEPVQVVAVGGQHFPLYRPAYRTIYYNDHATGGGAVQDALTHVLNAAEWLVGPVTRLTADAGHQVLEGVTVEDTAHVLTRHGTVMGSYSLNQHQAPNESTITVVCTRGTARFEFHNLRWRWMTEPGGEWTDEPAGPLERDTLFVRQANAFLDTAEGTAAPLCSLADARQTLAVNLAILRSAEHGGWERLEEPLPRPLPEAGRGERSGPPSGSPSPLRGGGRGEG
ncbi:MAG TPA: Gfo/Idh/MocA family oxidoreductase [Fimbriiglobus sp.]|nr:Gfo/Idh/MocA family oxidoreductase [Fimbriiglobus sp.]